MAATAHPTSHDAPEPRVREAHVQLTLVIHAEITDEDLEALAYDGLEAVNTHAAGVVLGPVVAWNTERREIDFDFTVAALSESEVHQRIGLVLSILERELPITRETSSRTATAPVAACI